MWLDAPCSTLLVEEAHGTGACLLRDHTTHAERTLRCRATIHACRAVVNPLPAHKRLGQLTKASDKQEVKAPKASAFRTFNTHTAGAIETGAFPDQATSFLGQQAVLREAHEIFESLPHAALRFWDMQGRKNQKLMEDMRDDDIGRLDAAIELVISRDKQWLDAYGVSNTVGNCRWDREQLDDLRSAFERIEGDTLKELLARSMETPPMIPDAESNM